MLLSPLHRWSGRPRTPRRAGAPRGTGALGRIGGTVGLRLAVRRGGSATGPLSAALLAAFGAVSALHLASLTAETDLLTKLTKPALMPMLAAYAVARGASRLLVAALLLSCAGDVLLQVGADVAFLCGMACFGAAHLCFVGHFVRGGALSSPARVRAAATAYGAVWLTGIALLWPDLGALRLPVAGYGLLLAATAATAVGLDVRAAVGGALFLFSDTLIAFDIAEWPRPPMAGLWVMATYITAEFLLVIGALRRPWPAGREAGRERAGRGVEPPRPARGSSAAPG